MTILNSFKYTGKALFLTLFLLFSTFAAQAQDGDHYEKELEHAPPGEGLTGHHSEEEAVGDLIMHHVMDSHDWHITDIGETKIELPLPWILYNSVTGFQFFMNEEKMLESDPHYLEHHGHVYYVKSHEPIKTFHDLSNEHEKAELEEMEKAMAGKIAVIHHKGIRVETATGEKTNFEHAEVLELVDGASIIDLSLTKTGLHVLIIAILMFFLFRAVAKGYQKNAGMAPKGVQSFFEPVILFVRDEVAKPFLHGKHDKFLPYLLTLFFFIWFSNMFGLTPLSSNIAGNTSITVMLALITLILILANSTKDFWLHIFWFPGVPIFVKPIMFVIEFMGLITKPAALAIRLFANISAGHFMVLSLICLIFILGDNGRSPGGAYAIMPLSFAFSLFIFLVEVIVAAVQAFVFSMLTAVFIGQAMETHSHDHEEGHH